MSPVERPPDPTKKDLLARTLSDALLGIGSPLVRQLVAGVVLIALMLLVLPLAIVVFIVTSLLFYGVLMLLGIPGGVLGAALGLTWFGGSLALIGWLCVLAWRRVGFIRLLARFASDSPEDAPAQTFSLSARDPNADTDTVLTRVTAADADLADSAGDAEDDERSYQ
jgi:hypothetical protein